MHCSCCLLLQAAPQLVYIEKLFNKIHQFLGFDKELYVYIEKLAKKTQPFATEKVRKKYNKKICL